PELKDKRQPLQTFKGHKDWVVSVAYSPDGSHLASASRDRTVKVWDVATGKETFTVKEQPSEIKCVAYSPDGKSLAAARGQWVKEKQQWLGEIKIWDAAGKELRAFKGHTAPIEGIAFSHDGKFLATASEDKTVIVWGADGKEVKTLTGHAKLVGCVAF